MYSTQSSNLVGSLTTRGRVRAIAIRSQPPDAIFCHVLEVSEVKD